MGFAYFHLQDHDVRHKMLDSWQDEWQELTDGWPRGVCYGKQLSDEGWAAYATAMPKALADHDDDWLLGELSDPSYWLARSPRRTKSGTTMVNYNKRDALERLAYGEFNIAYIRGVAQALIERGDTECVVYRANPAYEPRGECSTWEGQRFNLADVLTGHRARYFPPPGNRTIWSIPSGPHCHHSIRAVDV